MLRMKTQFRFDVTKPLNTMNYIIVDIETSAKPESELNFPEFEPSKVLKDPEKIKADIDKKKAEWISECALHADRSRALVIGVLFVNGNSEKFETFEGNEKEMLINFWNVYSNNEYYHLIGHYIKGFDIPFLIRRSWINGIVPKEFKNGRYLCDRFIDTMDSWACGTRDTISLDNLSKIFGLHGKNGKGSEFSSLYSEGGVSREKALAYLRNDLKLTQEVAKIMGLI